MFGLSFGELVVLLIVAVVVLGPKELPRYLRKAGEMAGRLRRMASDMREKSGIDEVLRTEGIEHDIAEIRRLARGELTGVVSAVRSAADPLRPGALLGSQAPGSPPTPGAAASPSATSGGGVNAPATTAVDPYLQTQMPGEASVRVNRQTEYPTEGADSYGALPDTATTPDPLPASPLADDALYARGEAA